MTNAMMKDEMPTEENLCRLALALIEREGGTYAEAKAKLLNLRLHLKVGADVPESPALQAALLTAVNAGKRAFLGGVTVELQRDGLLKLPWPAVLPISEVITSLGGIISTCPNMTSGQTICIGDCSSSEPDALSIWVADWRGGVTVGSEACPLSGDQTNPLAGVMAAAFGLARGFLQITGLTTYFVQRKLGFSLWRPDLPFDSPDAAGPALETLPANLWLAGLGHLGQGYAWNLGLLPYRNPESTLFVLQDYDRVVAGNSCAGLLCESDSPGKMKTRLCANWLEERGFQTRLVERRFDESLQLQEGEAMVALCGFDSVEPRRALQNAPFKFIVDCGIGGTHKFFDQFSMYTFPGTKTPHDIWNSAMEPQPAVNENLNRALGGKQGCGILAEVLARKQVATSFVGAFAGACAVSEILRGLNGGQCCEAATFHMRSDSPPRLVMRPGGSTLQTGFAGTTAVK